MCVLSNHLARVSFILIAVWAVQSVGHPASAAEVIVQNDSLTKGSLGAIQAGFAPGESAAAWLTSPCNGSIVAVQVFWRSLLGNAPQSLEDSITIFDAGVFPTPGAALAVLQGPTMTDSVINEFRFLDQNQTVPLNVPVTSGQTFVVSFKFLNAPDPTQGPSVVNDSGCQAGRNAIDAASLGWFSSCLLGVGGDWVIRAVVDCGAQPGACCEGLGVCNDGVTAVACGAAGGAYQGDGSNCASVTCAEACCFMPSGCLDLAFGDCGTAGGFAQGPGTTCGTTVCFPMGACCNPDGTCTDNMSPTDCGNSGGVYQGNDSLCANTSCPQPMGACCLSGGGCLSLTQGDCGVIPSNTTWAGALTACPDACVGVPVGACCNPDGTCNDGVAEPTCTSGGGIFQGDPSTCAGVSCPASQGACCVGQTCSIETDAGCTATGGVWAGVLTDCTDGNGNGVPDECDTALCVTADDCADLDADGVTDDVCIWWECVAGSCIATAKAKPSDVGSASGVCSPDTFCNLADALQALTCFAGNNTCDTINIDTGGPGGDCAPDGFCNLADALQALTCFANNNTCTCGPAPFVSPEPNVVGEAALIALPSRRTIQPGGEVQVRVFTTLQSPERRRGVGRENVVLRAYQLHTNVTGGRSGALELVSIEIEDREDFVFAAVPGEVFDAYNVAKGQMLSGLYDGDLATNRGGYLATFTYRASAEAAGTFVVDVLHDEANQDQTFLVGSDQTDTIEIADTAPAVIIVTTDRAAGLR